jgi:hypothetical protein
LKSGQNGLETGLESDWYGYIKLQLRSPAASSIVWTEPNKINHLAEREINDLAYALDAWQVCGNYH